MILLLIVRTEYKKGVLFVRLIGRLDNEGYLEKINWLIEEFGIKFIVINVTNLDDVSLIDIYHIIKYKQKLKKKKRLLWICDENKIRDPLFKKVIPKLANEIEAFSLIKRKDAYE